MFEHVTRAGGLVSLFLADISLFSSLFIIGLFSSVTLALAATAFYCYKTKTAKKKKETLLS